MLIEGEFLVPMRESKEDCLRVRVPGCRPFVCVADDSFGFRRVGHVLCETDSNSFRYLVSLDFVD